ncbi:MAG: restriction endonuclease subunit S [Methanobacterium sp.]|jgi:type I restriction enzyme S subunit
MNKEKNLPDNWKNLRLIDVSKSIASGGTPRRNIKEYWENGDIPWLKISDLKSTYINKSMEKITLKGLNNSSTKLFPKGTILYSIFATLGAIGILNFDSTTNQAIAGITPDNKIVETKYIYYCLKSERQNIIAKKSHATQDNINLKILKNHEMPIPPLNTQHKIVKILENAEKMKLWRVKAANLTNEYLKSLFMYTFGDPRDNSKLWDVVNFNKLAKIEKKSINPDSVDKNSNYIGLEHIESETGRILNIMTVQEAGLKSNKYVFDEECVLYGKLRPYLNKVALPNFKGISSTDILPIKSIEGKSNKYFIKFLLSHPYYIKKSTEMSTGANLPRISSKAIEKFKVYLPPVELQNQFAEIIQNVETLKNYQEQSKIQIDNLFNNLMQKAFKGELTC